MITKNNWISVSVDPEFKVTLSPYKFEAISFQAAVDLTVSEISKNHSNLYLALSGGYDSEFILRAFHKAGVAITPVIVCFGNEKENEYALKVCEELSIIPVRINLSSDEFIHYFFTYIHKNRFKSFGYHSTQVFFAAEYASANNGTLITGNHLCGDGDEIIEDSEFANMNEWDFYLDFTHPHIPHIDLFLYTPELAYAMLPQTTATGICWQDYKHNLFGIEHRTKMRAKYPKDVRDDLRSMWAEMQYEYSPYSWTRSEINSIFKINSV